MPEDPDAGIVIEVKHAKEMKVVLDAACETARWRRLRTSAG
ncbi:MAG: hypothetical protein ACLTLY_08490 [Agathobacter rectalis]